MKDRQSGPRSSAKRKRNPWTPERRYRSFNQLGHDLLEITKGCRPDMHEPDEAEVDAFVIGKHFDNAGTDTELEVAIVSYAIGKRDDFNLASLIALARIGAAVCDLDEAIRGTSAKGEAIRAALQKGKRLK